MGDWLSVLQGLPDHVPEGLEPVHGHGGVNTWGLYAYHLTRGGMRCLSDPLAYAAESLSSYKCTFVPAQTPNHRYRGWGRGQDERHVVLP